MDPTYDEKQPIYMQIVQRIYASILRGEYKAGDKLPAVIDAAIFFKVNHNTIQRVYGEMIREGIAVTRRGEGTFVTSDDTVLEALRKTLRQGYMENFWYQMRQLGYTDEAILDAIQSYLRQKESSSAPKQTNGE
jgi:GntR family transcriptional regulator